MASDEAEAIAKRLERAFAFNDWTAFWGLTKSLYEQGIRDGGAVPAGSEVESLPEDSPPPPAPPPRAAPKPKAEACPECGGAGERTVSLPRDPNSPTLEKRTVIGTCPDCGGTGGKAAPKEGEPERTGPDRPEATFTGGGEDVRQPAAALPPEVVVRPLPPVLPAAGRYALVGDAVVDKQKKAVAYRGADAAAVYEALAAS